MKIGVMDSGLGGLIITKAFIEKLPQYDYVYFGDTKNLPYGDKKSTDVLQYTIDAVEFLIKKECKIIIIACNTATSIALRYLQRKYMPKHHPDIKVLGVVVPTVETAIASSNKAIGVVATNSTINSHIYRVEIEKINHKVKVFEVATPKLVPLIESGNFSKAETEIEKYLKEFGRIDCLILGCTHYPILTPYFKKHLPKGVEVISQYEFMGDKLANYLQKHPEVESVLDKSGRHEFFVSFLTDKYQYMARKVIKGVRIKEA